MIHLTLDYVISLSCKMINLSQSKDHPNKSLIHQTQEKIGTHNFIHIGVHLDEYQYAHITTPLNVFAYIQYNIATINRLTYLQILNWMI